MSFNSLEPLESKYRGFKSMRKRIVRETRQSVKELTENTRKPLICVILLNYYPCKSAIDWK